jgi:MerR family transcriptional regulator, heat shock protein HspR
MATTQRFIEPHEQPRAGRGRATAVMRRAVPCCSRPDGRRASSPADERRMPTDAVRPPPQANPAIDLDAPVYVISVAAEMSDLHPQTLRAYERDGLLEPARTPGGTRRYSRRDVERLRLIRRLTQDEGLNLAGVRLVLELGEKLDASRRRVVELEEVVRLLAERIEQRPATTATSW